MFRRVGAGVTAGVGLALVVLAPTAQTQPGGGKGGPGGFGPPGGQERKLVAQFDKNNDGWLNADERAAAREEAKKGGRGGKGFGGFGGPGGKGGGREAPKPGPAVTPAQVKTYPDLPFYDPAALRTLFFEFENKDWEAEMQDFHNTDVEVPATLTVDGKTYRNVGVSFRGMSSYMGVPAGSKRSLNVSLDLADKTQRVGGYKTLNLLNGHDDPSLMSSVLYSHVARQYTPTPKANFARVVINGECWGVYANLQQFNKEFLEENYKTSKGTRWKVRGSPGGRGGLEYFGDNPDDYKRVFTVKGDDSPKAWKALVTLCKTLNQTPADKLEDALKPMLDIDGLLWFLALDVALINNDGYWVRASDYSLFLDPKGKFHVIPHDMNEAFRGGMGGPGGPGGPGGGMMMFRLPPPGEMLPPPLVDALQLTDDQRKRLDSLHKEAAEKLDKVLSAEQRKQLKDMRDRGPGGFGGPGGPPGGPGGPGGPPGGPGGPGGFGGRGGGGVTLDPLVGLNDASKPLRSKILAVPALRAKYLANVKVIAEKSLDWNTLGPVVAKYRDLIDKDVELDTRKLDSTEAFRRATADVSEAGGGRGMPLRQFADQRRKFLLDYAEPKAAPKP